MQAGRPHVTRSTVPNLMITSTDIYSPQTEFQQWWPPELGGHTVPGQVFLQRGWPTAVIIIVYHLLYGVTERGPNLLLNCFAYV